MTSKRAVTSIYQLKITLKGSDPKIWRRALVAGSTSLAELHVLIQVVMPWTNSHLHQFVVDGERYASPDILEDDDEMDTQDASTILLADAAPSPKSKFLYTYDFGDDWAHEIVVEKILEASADYPGYPVCLAGENAAPPEDCGGVYGYAQMLDSLDDPRSAAENEELLEWLGENPDPTAFDLVEVNEELRTVFAKKRKKSR